ncbi:E3 ubiquitin-protein ligase CCNB1IP1 homolog isoform X3 [Rutidosis leptorrhynchoides]|uniref:E3 ubiquitin-protein ligase CCNB1IP1 homolog isoform X3 n=1 Tax=Rutidosis leptorrhynchoides TaxID=125765 RepID=UPI003A9973E4
MRCNACWRELEGRAITTTCGHLLCNEDASKILSNDAACPMCDQVLSKSLMKPVDINPNDEWTNMDMTGISPQTLMKSAYRSVMFFIGQKEIEMQFKTNRIVTQCKQKCEAMQEKFTEKMEQIHTAYQKMSKRCQMMEQEIENLSKDKQELQEKFSEKSRQKRKLDEMYDQLRSEYESVKRSAIQPANNFFSRTDPDLFASPANVMDNRDPMRKGPREDMWPQATRQNSSNSGPFDIATSPPTKRSAVRVVVGGGGDGGGGVTLRNLKLSPMKRPQVCRSRPPMFT